MKITNYQALVLLELEDTESDKGIWRPELAEGLSTPKTTLHDNLIRLQLKNLVDNYEDNNGLRGRNRVFWYITKLGKRAVVIIQEGMR